MNREDIIRMAHESHLDVYGLGKDYAKFADALERFAALVASAERERIKLVQTGVGIEQRAEEAYEAAKHRSWVGVSDEVAQPEQAPMNYYRADAEGNLERTDIHFAQPKQDWIERERAVGYREGHMAALAQRKWVGLTNAEVKKIVGSDRYTDLLLEVVNFVEAKLKEKNCG